MKRARIPFMLALGATLLCTACYVKPGDGASSDAVGGALFTVQEPWTKDVGSLDVADRSDAIIAALVGAGGWGTDNRLRIDFSIPVYFADRNAPRMQVTGVSPTGDEYCFGGPDCEPLPFSVPVPAGATIEGSQDLTCDVTGNTEGQGDCHLLVVDRSAQRLYELYQATSDGDALQAVVGVEWDLAKTYPDDLRGDQCTSADAAGLPIAALLPTADEVAAGSIDHAIRFILPNDRMKADVYVRPATHAGGPDSADADAPPYGVRFRLKADFDESTFTPNQQIVLRAMKKYGMVLSDGGNVPLTFADDRASNAKWADLGIAADSFDALTPDVFEVVDLGDEIAVTNECARS